MRSYVTDIAMSEISLLPGKLDQFLDLLGDELGFGCRGGTVRGNLMTSIPAGSVTVPTGMATCDSFHTSGRLTPGSSDRLAAFQLRHINN